MFPQEVIAFPSPVLSPVLLVSHLLETFHPVSLALAVARSECGGLSAVRRSSQTV